MFIQRVLYVTIALIKGREASRPSQRTAPSATTRSKTAITTANSLTIAPTTSNVVASRAANSNSPQLKLPPELRNLIYGSIAKQTTKTVIQCGKIKENPPLAITCRLIRQGFFPIFKYRSIMNASTVEFTVRDSNFVGVMNFL